MNPERRRILKALKRERHHGRVSRLFLPWKEALRLLLEQNRRLRATLKDLPH
jgi:hypothetical protein